MTSVGSKLSPEFLFPTFYFTSPYKTDFQIKMSNCLLLLFYSIVYILLLFIIMLIIIVILINYHRKIVQDSCNLTKVPLFAFSHCVNGGLTLVRLGFMMTNTVMNIL